MTWWPIAVTLNFAQTFYAQPLVVKLEGLLQITYIQVFPFP
jgi:hypothetical protein